MPSSNETRARRWRPHHCVGALTGFVVGVLVLGPGLWHPGFFLGYDMVFVPRLPFSAATLGIDGGVPRAVPNDVVVALLSALLPGWLVQRLVLVGAFVAVGAGVDRLRITRLATVAATVALTWNPWVGERLTIGHWGYLWGYAALVWLCAAALQRERGEDAPGLIATALVVSALSGSTGAVLVGVAAVVLLVPGRGVSPRVAGRRFALGAGWWLALNAAWWFPFLALAPSSAADLTGVRAFAARADSAGGVAVSLLTGGGIWHAPSWFDSRQSPVLVGLALLVVVAGAAGLLRGVVCRSRWLVLAALGLVLAGAGSAPSTRGLVDHLVLDVPGGGLVRDGQKFVAWTLVPCGLGLGLLVDDVVRRVRGTVLAGVVVIAAVVLPVLTLPDLAWGRQGTWQTHRYPQEYTEVAKQLDGSTVAVFPWSLYRSNAWNGGRPVLDPWQRLIDGRVLVNDDLPLRDGVVRGEDEDAAGVTQAMTAQDPGRVRTALRQVGVRYVLVEKDQPGVAAALAETGQGARTVHDGPLLRVLDLGPAAAQPRSRWWSPAGLVVTGLSVLATVSWNLRRRRKPPERGGPAGRGR